jgi:hypothetical protein
MNKLTKDEAQSLFIKAWKDVEKYSLGSYRFGQSLWNLIPNDIIETMKDFDQWGDYGFTDVDCCFYYEPNSDIVIEKFYKYFV